MSKANRPGVRCVCVGFSDSVFNVIKFSIVYQWPGVAVYTPNKSRICTGLRDRGQYGYQVEIEPVRNHCEVFLKPNKVIILSLRMESLIVLEQSLVLSGSALNFTLNHFCGSETSLKVSKGEGRRETKQRGPYAMGVFYGVAGFPIA